MKHYEVVFMVHPDQSDQVPGMVERYAAHDRARRRKVHRHRGLGPSPTRLSRFEIHKAHYVLMNIEIDRETLEALESAFRFNDAVLRNLVISRKEAETGISKIYEEELREQEKDRERERRREEEARVRIARRQESEAERQTASTHTTAAG